MKAICVLFIVLALVLQVNSQASPSNSASLAISTSNTNSWTPSGTITVTGSNSNSNSITGTITVTPSRTVTVSVTRTSAPSTSNSWTTSVTVTNTVPSPPAPVSLTNLCPNHIVNACPSWSDPTGITFNSYILSYRISGSTNPPNVITLTATSGRVTALLPATTYDFFVQGILNGVTSLVSTTVQITTAAADPKLDKTRDINNIACTNVKSTVTNRSVILCTWSAALDTVLELRIKARCTSEIREPNEVRKHLFGTRATVTTVTLNMNRDVAVCNVYFRARYARRPASRHHLTVIMGQ
jgi:hypothetical protein